MEIVQDASFQGEIGPIDIYSGDLKMVFSCTITSFGRQPIKIVFGQENNRLNLILSFFDEVDLDKKKPKIVAKNLDDNTLELKLVNFNSPLGSYNLEPVYIADFSGLPLFLSFYVIGHKEGSNKTMHLAIYIKTSNESGPNLEASQK